MSGLEFTASAIGSRAWPVAAVIIAGIFRKQIVGLLAKIRKLNWGDASVELSEQLDRVEDKSREVPGDTAVDLTLPDVRFQQLIATHRAQQSWIAGARSNACSTSLAKT